MRHTVMSMRATEIMLKKMMSRTCVFLSRLRLYHLKPFIALKISRQTIESPCVSAGLAVGIPEKGTRSRFETSIQSSQAPWADKCPLSSLRSLRHQVGAWKKGIMRYRMVVVHMSTRMTQSR